MKKPLLICLTPVFNEAWILPAFLKATSLWADYIIIADQMSTDESREIYKQFDKVVVIDNPRKEMHQARTRKLLFEEANKIDGDKILFTLDADEFLSGDFLNSDNWQVIINSEPGDVFLFRWMNLHCVSNKYTTWQHYYWAAHVNNDIMNGQFPDNFIHEWRLPWPNVQNKEYKIDDISFIHYARVNVKRQQNKERFYQVSTASKLPKYSGVGFYRQYHPIEDATYYDIPNDAYKTYEENGIDINSLLNLEDDGQHYTDNVINYISKYGINKFAKLDIWNKEFLRKNNLTDPRNSIDKILHYYLRRTNRWQKFLFIKFIDKILKMLGY